VALESAWTVREWSVKGRKRSERNLKQEEIALIRKLYEFLFVLVWHRALSQHTTNYGFES